MLDELGCSEWYYLSRFSWVEKDHHIYQRELLYVWLSAGH